MKPLEHRRWFAVLSIFVSLVVTAALWQFTGLPWRLSSGLLFVFATVGVGTAAHPLLALAMIRLFPALGAV